MFLYAGTTATLSPVVLELLVIVLVAFLIAGTYVYACSQS